MAKKKQCPDMRYIQQACLDVGHGIPVSEGARKRRRDLEELVDQEGNFREESQSGSDVNSSSSTYPDILDGFFTNGYGGCYY